LPPFGVLLARVEHLLRALLLWTVFDADAGFEGTDHELVSHRLRWLIENSVMVEAE